LGLSFGFKFWAAMCPSIFVDSEPKAFRVRVESESPKFFSSQSRVMTWSSQSRVTRTVKSF